MSRIADLDLPDALTARAIRISRRPLRPQSWFHPHPTKRRPPAKIEIVSIQLGEAATTRQTANRQIKLEGRPTRNRSDLTAAPKRVSPGRDLPNRGSCSSAEGPVSRILSCAVIPLGAALPRTLISDLPGGFGNCRGTPATKTCRRGPRSSRLAASGRCVAPPGSFAVLPSLFGLAPCGVYPAPAFTVRAVRSYRTFSPLPRRWSFRNGKRPRQAGLTRVLRFQGGPPERGVAEAVSFLWHWPSMGLEAHVPDVIRHTALRSSDFPPPEFAVAKPRQRPPGPPASP